MSDFKETIRGDCMVVALAGKLDAATTPAIQAVLLERIRGGHKYLGLDFSGVSYLASSGLRMLLVLARTTTELEGRIVLCGLNATMRETLDVVGFLPNFVVAADDLAAFALLEG